MTCFHLALLSSEASSAADRGPSSFNQLRALVRFCKLGNIGWVYFLTAGEEAWAHRFQSRADANNNSASSWSIHNSDNKNSAHFFHSSVASCSHCREQFFIICDGGGGGGDSTYKNSCVRSLLRGRSPTQRNPCRREGND